MTQLLNEMIELHETRLLNEHIEMLVEYLGNLAVIDRNLVKSLKKAATTYGPKKSAKLAPPVGQKSKVEKKIATGKNSDQLWKTFDEEPEIVAFVVDYDGQQIMAISDRKRMGADPTNANYTPTSKNATEASIFVMTTPEFYSAIMPEEDFDAKFDSAMSNSRRGYNMGNNNKSSELKGGATQAKSFVRKVLDIVVKKAREEKKDVSIMYIFRDADKKATQAARADAQKGRVMTPNDKKSVTDYRGRDRGTQYKVYIDGLKSELRERLDKFKASKAKNFTSTVEMLEFIKKEGYLDKIKFNGMNYDMKNSNVHLDTMIKRARAAAKGKEDDTGWLSESYIDYSMDWDERSAAYKKAHKEAAAENPDMTPDEVSNVIRDKLPPSTLKVIFKLEGGVIVPDKVTFVAH